MIGNRPSSLPIAQYCSLSPILGEQHGAGRSAAMSTVFHAKCAGSPEWPDLYHRLDKAEQAIINTWHKPTPIELTPELTLNYEDAMKEVPVGLDVFCGPVTKDDPTCMTGGTVDMYWIVEGAKTIAYVPDLKRSERTSEVDSPQLHCYGLAVAAKHECDAYVTGIWSLEDGTWEWGDMVNIDSKEGLEAWKRVKAAAMNTDGQASFGSHCDNCWERGHCPEWTFSPEHGDTLLAPFCEGGTAITQENALELLLACKRVDDTRKKAMELLKHYARDAGGILNEDGTKVWGKIHTKGRKSLDKDKLEEEHPGLLKQYTSIGKPGSRFDWKNNK